MYSTNVKNYKYMHIHWIYWLPVQERSKSMSYYWHWIIMNSQLLINRIHFLYPFHRTPFFWLLNSFLRIFYLIRFCGKHLLDNWIFYWSHFSGHFIGFIFFWFRISLNYRIIQRNDLFQIDTDSWVDWRNFHISTWVFRKMKTRTANLSK